jgi:cell division protein FtsQ
MRSLRVGSEDRPTIAPVRAPRRPAPVRPARPPRRALLSGTARRRLRMASAALALLVLAGGSAWLWRSGQAEVWAQAVIDTTAKITARAGFAIGDVELAGREHVPADAVLQASGLHRGDAILFVDLAALRTRIEQIGWVASATVERRLPDTIHIAIVERRPFARWQIEGKTVLIDRQGVVLERDDPEQYRDLLRVVGPGASKAAASLFQLLATEPQLGQRVVNAVRVRDRRWDLEFDNGVTVRMPEDGVADAWVKLAQLEREQKILGRDIAGVDLRLADRVVVRLTPEAMAARKTPGKNT